MMTTQERQILQESLQFFHVDELKDLLMKFSLPPNGKKGALISRLLHFLEKGEIKNEEVIPKVSCARKGQIYPLHQDTLILKGVYKNALKTRLFFKNLIGNHFHFTAFGQDWIKERWMEGDPPTYKEFAEMWQAEYDRRRKVGSEPKPEWAYIRFIQNFLKQYPQTSKNLITEAWQKERKKQRETANQILKNYIQKL